MKSKRLVTGLRVLAGMACVVVLLIGCLAVSIYSYGNNTHDFTGVQAQAAVVLGAAVWGTKPSPVFRERINHAINLYRGGKIRKIIFTGGQGEKNEPAESVAAQAYAVQQGVLPADILLEKQSHTTHQNLYYAKRIVDEQRLQRVLIVSDPLHMKRAMRMARTMGLEAYPSPTPTTRYKSLRSQFGFLAHETYYYLGDLLHRPSL